MTTIYTHAGQPITFHHLFAAWSGQPNAEGTQHLGRLSVESTQRKPTVADWAEAKRIVALQWPAHAAGAVVRQTQTEELVPCPCSGINADCGECDGTGMMPSPEESCWDCGGEGSVCVAEAQLYGPPERCYPAEYAECPSCEGSGRVLAATGGVK